MKNKQKVFILAGIGVLSAIIGTILVFKDKFKKPVKQESTDVKEQTTNTTQTSTQSSSTQSSSVIASDTFPLKYGSKGKYVMYLQCMLNYLYSSGLVVDGWMGNSLITAITNHPPVYSLAFSKGATITILQSDYIAYMNKVVVKGSSGYKDYLLQNMDAINSKMAKYGVKLTKDNLINA
jgi:hypothetical protein